MGRADVVASHSASRPARAGGAALLPVQAGRRTPATGLAVELEHLVGHPERLVRNAHHRLGRGDVLGAEGEAVGRWVVGVGR